MRTLFISGSDYLSCCFFLVVYQTTCVCQRPQPHHGLTCTTPPSFPFPPGFETMNYEVAHRRDVFAAINNAVLSPILLQARHAAMTKSMQALAVDPEAHGDVATHLVGVVVRRFSNAWVAHHADEMTLDIMQLVITRHHEIDGERVPAVFQGWTVVRKDDPSRRNKFFKLYVAQRLHTGQSWFRRVLYNAVLYYVVNRDRDHVDIVMLFPDVDQPNPSEALGHKYYAYAKKMVVGPTARISSGESEAARTDGSTVQEVRGCLVQDSDLLLKAYLTSSAVFSPVTVAALAAMLRGMVIDLDFDWHFVPPSDQEGDVTDGPNAWRLLLPRPSTCEKIDTLKYEHGMC